VAHVDLRLAELFLDEGKNEQAALSARRAADVFEKTKGTSDEASANLLLAEDAAGSTAVSLTPARVSTRL